MATQTDFVPTTLAPQFVPSGGTLQPGKGLSITSNDAATAAQLVRFDLQNTFASDPALVTAGFGKLADPTGAGQFLTPNTSLLEVGTVAGDPNGTIFTQRMTLTAPTLPNGEAMEDTVTFLTATSATPGGALTSNIAQAKAVVDIVTPPSIQDATANQPVAAMSAIRPFSTVTLKDSDFKPSFSATDSATITITDGGAATDADGLLTGDGLSKTGVGTYSIADSSTANLQGFLRGLQLTTANVNTTAALELDVTDTKAALTAKDTTASVQIVGKATAPIIAGTVAGLTVAPGNTIHPFSTVSISDTQGASDSATIKLTGGDANGKLSGPGVTASAPGVYTIAATDIPTLNADIDGATFTPTALPAGQTSVTTGMEIDVTNTASKQTATDTKTTVTEQASSGPPTTNPGDNFLIVNQTTGAQSTASGDPHTGPVPGIDRDLILITKDNLNISAQIPNVFIHSGSGNDAIQVLGGTNILDGSTGTNFLTGGTGLDTFFIDDRTPPQDIFSTVANFHTGDSVSVFGIAQGAFTITPGDNVLPSAPGLDFAITAAGAKNANFNIPGYSVADLSNGRLTQTFGKTADGTDFMMIHANG